MDIRPRRLRAHPAIRRLNAEVHIDPATLILPVFVTERSEAQPIESMPGVWQHPIEDLEQIVAEAQSSGIGGLMIFAVPAHRDATGSQAVDPEGILHRATRRARELAADNLLISTDLCLDEFTDHGHCGVLDEAGNVDNDASVERYRQMALASARAGSQMLGVSGMMDGQVAAIRDELETHGFVDVAILAYSAKYASSFYGPFRDAVDSTLTGDRRSYQLNPANRREGLREAQLDIDEGADVVMVKPAMSYLDVLRDVAQFSEVPVWAYQVSGEYSMIEAAAASGWIDRRSAVLEALTSIYRAGAQVVLSYWAIEAATWIQEENR